MQEDPRLPTPDSHHFWLEPIPHEYRLAGRDESDPFLPT